MIELRQLTKRFGDIEVVRDLSFSIAPGTVLGFLGPNGAGKSTTMKMITGFLEPTSGSVEVYGHDVVTNRRAAQTLVGYLPEGAPCYEDMSVKRFLSFMAEMRGFSGVDRDRRVAEVIGQLSMNNVAHQRIETLSKGFKRRVGLAQAILHDPQVLILDEPTDGLDPNQKRQVREMIKNLAEDKIVIISTHILEEVSAVCGRAIIINQGQAVLDASTEALMARAAAYGGLSLGLAQASQEAVMARLGSLGPNVQIHVLGEHRYIVSGQPSEGSLATRVIECVQTAGWAIEHFEQLTGALDAVFADVTEGRV